jgi:hypothetical protein
LAVADAPVADSVVEAGDWDSVQAMQARQILPVVEPWLRR